MGLAEASSCTLRQNPYRLAGKHLKEAIDMAEIEESSPHNKYKGE
jgi:hypothetical protein